MGVELLIGRGLAIQGKLLDNSIAALANGNLRSEWSALVQVAQQEHVGYNSKSISNHVEAFRRNRLDA